MSAGVAVEALTLTLGAFQLKNLNFALAPGEILVVLGPNGAGKSVALETIAGFHRPESGRVRIGDRDVTALPPERRNVGFVVQNFGLFPHLTVLHNVAIARRSRGSTRAATRPDGDPAALLSYFGVAHLAARLPGHLSPGEKQRVALARALAGAAELFLFDEPFSALDAATRDQLREELKSFLRALKIPAIFVTHDRSDAVSLADAIVVLRDGVVVQSGPAVEVLQKPASSAVARFIGVENIVPARVTAIANGGVTLAIGEQVLRATAPAEPLQPGSTAFLNIRAEDVTLCAPPDPGPPRPPGVNVLHGRVSGLRKLGPLVTVEIECGFPLRAYLLRPQAELMRIGTGRAVAVAIAADAIHVTAD